MSDDVIAVFWTIYQEFSMARHHQARRNTLYFLFGVFLVYIVGLVGVSDQVFIPGSITITLPALGTPAGTALAFLGAGVTTAGLVGIALALLATKAGPLIQMLQRLQRFGNSFSDEDLARIMDLLQGDTLAALQNLNPDDLMQLQDALNAGQLQMLSQLTPEQLDALLNLDPDQLQQLNEINIDDLRQLQNLSQSGILDGDLLGGDGDYDDDGTGGNGTGGLDYDQDELQGSISGNFSTERPLSEREQRFIQRVNRTGTLPPRLKSVPPKVLKNTGLFDSLPRAIQEILGIADLRRRFDLIKRYRRKWYHPFSIFSKAKKSAIRVRHQVEKALYSHYTQALSARNDLKSKVNSFFKPAAKKIDKLVKNSRLKFRIQRKKNPPLSQYAFGTGPLATAKLARKQNTHTRKRPRLRVKRRYRRHQVDPWESPWGNKRVKVPQWQPIISKAKNSRSFRNEEENYVSLEPIFKEIEVLDSEFDCGKLYVCELATRQKQDLKPEEMVLLTLLEDHDGCIALASAKGPFDMAAKLGDLTKDVNSCRSRYDRCEVKDGELMKNPFHVWKCQ